MDLTASQEKPIPKPYPFYPPKGLVYLNIFWVALLGKRRSFRQDSRRMMGRLRPPPKVEGAERIPLNTPCLITINHYNRPGFNAMWIGMAVSSAAPKEIHWLMTNAWTFEGMWYAPFAMPISRWVIGRLAHVYGMTTTPPNPPKPADAAERGVAIRRLMAFIRRSPAPLLAITPEGQDYPGAVLGPPPAGFGRLTAQLAQMGFVFLPAGIYEQEGALCLRFGTPYRFNGVSGLSKEAADRLYSRAVMARIAPTLPAHMQGEYADDEDNLEDILEDLQ